MTNIGAYMNQVNRTIKHAFAAFPYPGSCPYCHEPRKVMFDGSRLIPPIDNIDWWGIVPRYSHRRIGTIKKCDKCPICGRSLNS